MTMTETPPQQLGLEELVRELVRSEVRAELAKTSTSAPATPTYVTAAEYAKARSISVSSVRNAIRTGRLPALKIGAAVRVRADVEIGAPVVPTEGATAPPIVRAEQILARRRNPPRLANVG
jgi:hypothetical protein